MLHRLEGSGLRNVYLKNGYSIEGVGDCQTVAYFDLEGLYVAIARALSTRVAPLTGPEFRFLRKRLELSQGEAGAMVGKTAQAVAKWEKEQASVPIAEGNLLRLAWLNKHARRALSRTLDMMTRATDDVAGDYVFEFTGSEWVDDAAKSVFLPLISEAHATAVAAIGMAMLTSSASVGGVTLPQSHNGLAPMQAGIT